MYTYILSLVLEERYLGNGIIVWRTNGELGGGGFCFPERDIAYRHLGRLTQNLGKHDGLQLQKMPQGVANKM